MHTANFRNTSTNYNAIFTMIMDNGGRLELVIGKDGYTRLDISAPKELINA